MKIERLRKNHKKEIIMGGLILVSIISAITLVTTRAKYRVTQDIKLAKGTVNYKPYDFKIMAMYQQNDNGKYTEINEMPTSGYVVNEEKSYCTVDNTTQVKGKIKTIDGNHVIKNLRKSDKCYVWFNIDDSVKPTIDDVKTSVTKTEINITVTATDNKGVTEYWYQIDNQDVIKSTDNTYKFTGLTAGSTHTIKIYVKDAVGNESDTITKSVKTTSDIITISDIIAANNPKTTTPTFANIATTNEGVYAVSDGMYGGTSYYWRGAVTTNYVKFANKCWRIVRINGDGTMRLIYDGDSCNANGTSTQSSIALTQVAYNASVNASYYVGWTYSTGSQRTTGGTSSNAKVQTETWYNNNIGNNTTYSSKIADGKFCNDRNTGSGGSTTSWSATGTQFYYATYNRIKTNAPTLNCPSGDIYILKAGAITADEVVYAGAVDEKANSSYFLYNGKGYLTMSPYQWVANAHVFRVESYGNLLNTSTNHNGFGIRPVINLKADTTFAVSGDGTQSNPYVVS